MGFAVVIDQLARKQVVGFVVASSSGPSPVTADCVRVVRFDFQLSEELGIPEIA
jgi:hypothetical protein